jgi:hypothetical protein
MKFRKTSFVMLFLFAISSFLHIKAHAQAGSVLLSPSGNQNVSQPSGTTLNVNSLNMKLNASLFPGADIGAQINNAIAALPISPQQYNLPCGVVEVPSGNYSVFSTTVKIPQCVTVQGANDATRLNWTGSGCAFVLASIPGPGEYVHGVLQNLKIIGALGSAGQTGICEGGDPAGSYASAQMVGYNYIVRNVNVEFMHTGVFWGNNTFNTLYDHVTLLGNDLGFNYPTNAVGGGQNSTFLHLHVSSNGQGVFIGQNLPMVTLSFIGGDFEYSNGSTAQGGGSTSAEITGGHWSCVECHFEDYRGTLVTMLPGLSVNILGGQFIEVGSGAPDPYMIAMDSGNGSLWLEGTYIYLLHGFTNLVSTPQMSGGRTLHVANISLTQSGAYMGPVTAATGAGIDVQDPFNNQTGAGIGNRYIGGTLNLDTVNIGGNLAAAGGFFNNGFSVGGGPILPSTSQIVTTGYSSAMGSCSLAGYLPIIVNGAILNLAVCH